MAKFWKPTGGGSDGGALRGDGNVGILNVGRNKHLSISQQRLQLPIYRYRTDILFALEKFRTLVLVGGK
jgi:hypothetical protein